MNKNNIEITNKDRVNLSMRVSILILCVCLISYIFKVLGSDIFNKFITNDKFIKISNTIDTNYILNNLCYGLLGYIITQFAFCVTCGKLKLRWFEYLIVFIFSIIMSVLRYHFVGDITYLFDLMQYIIVPLIYGCITRKTNFIANLMNTLILYFVSNGLMFINLTLCELNEIMYYSNFIAYVLCFIEIYAITISISIFMINGGYSYVKSNVGSKQK